MPYGERYIAKVSNNYTRREVVRNGVDSSSNQNNTIKLHRRNRLHEQWKHMQLLSVMLRAQFTGWIQCPFCGYMATTSDIRRFFQYISFLAIYPVIQSIRSANSRQLRLQYQVSTEWRSTEWRHQNKIHIIGNIQRIALKWEPNVSASTPNN